MSMESRQAPKTCIRIERDGRLSPSVCNIRVLAFKLCLLYWWTSLVDGAQNKTVVTEETPSIEEEILGPLRVWHIVFIVFTILIIIMVIAFCCTEIRVPRSRQEIEDNYSKRLLNQRYVHMLEGRPRQLIRPHDNPQRTTEIATISSSRQPTQPGPRSRGDRNHAPRGPKPGPSSRRTALEDEDEAAFRRAGPMLGSRPLVNGKPTPLVINPKDILAIMAQQRKTPS